MDKYKKVEAFIKASKHIGNINEKAIISLSKRLSVDQSTLYILIEFNRLGGQINEN